MRRPGPVEGTGRERSRAGEERHRSEITEQKAKQAVNESIKYNLFITT